MLHKILNYRLNLNNLHLNESFIQETNNPISDCFLSISNLNTLDQNEYKIEDGTLDYSLIDKNPLYSEINNFKHIEKGIKLNISEEKTFDVFGQNRFSIIKKNNDNPTQSTYCFEFEKSNINLFKKKRLGRKRKDDNTIGEHNKFSDDNLRRKTKSLVMDYALEFINERIKIIYKGKIGNGIHEKKLLSLDQKYKSDTSIENNRNFLYKTLGEIFSGDISSKFAIKYPEYNKNIINRLLNEKDENKKQYFNRLFNIKFLQCIEAFCGADDCEELKGFKKFRDIKNNLKDKNEPKYLDILEAYLNNFEENINNKKGRKLKRKNEEKEKKSELNE